MDEDTNSWIRRTKFSHTVCHRLDSVGLASLPLTIQLERPLGSEVRPSTSSNERKSPTGDSEGHPDHVISRAERYQASSQIRQHSLTNKQRSLSPSQQTLLSDAFKEARSDCKRFSTPTMRRKDPEKGNKGKWFHKEPHESKSNSCSNKSPLRHLGTLKIQEGTKSRKESAWTKYFDHGGRRVNAVDGGGGHSLDMSKLYLGLRFAHGLHSRLYHGKYNDEPVAVKLIRVPDDDENGSLAARLEKQFNIEVTLLSRLRHPNVIKFIGACKEPPVYCIVAEFLLEGSLRAYLHKLEDKSLPMPKLIEFALDISQGMEYVHSQGVIHRDLKPENVLIDENFHLKIADFGIACEEEYCDLLADDPGTYRWMAPEMIKRKPYGRKADVYSFGLVLWEMVAGTVPYDDMNPIQAAFAVVHKNLRPVIPESCPPAMQALIEQCWCVQPDKRPEFWQIVKVLEQFESSLRHDGTLNLLPNKICRDHKKGLRRWVQKLGPTHQTASQTMPKPKFA